MKKTYLIKYVFLLLFVMSAVTVFAQTGVINCKVLDENNQTLPGVTVTVKGTQKSTATDINGVYRLTGVSGTVTLQFSFVGYKPMEKVVNVSGNVTVDASLIPGAKDLAEVVVIGYGTQQKKDLTGSITSVTSKDFNTGNITSPEGLIQGKVAGVSIVSGSGAPGSAPTIRIRGGASVYGSSEPLYVIDGVPISNDGVAGVADPLALINPNDIESFSILKDASATAIYGNRASSGVIIITTKKGAKGKPRINFTGNVSFGNLPKEYPVLTPTQFRDYVNANGTPAEIAQLGTANTDWQKQIYQNTVSTDDNLSISGATANGKLPYRVSVGYDKQNGILKTTGLDRYTGSVNLSPSLLNDHLKLNFNFLGTSAKQRFANEGGVIGSAVGFNPTLPVYSGNSNFGGYYEILDPSAADGLKSLAPLNPVGLLYEENNRSHTERAITSLAVDYKVHFLPDLHVILDGSIDYSNGSGFNDIPAYAASQYPGSNDANGNLQRGSNSSYKKVQNDKSFDGYLSYSHNFTNIKSSVSATAGYEEQTFTITANNYPTYFGNGEVNPNTIPLYAFNRDQYDLTALFARATYNYDDKYILSGTIRSDVSTKFAPGIRTGTFPSVSFAWVINHEDFLKNDNVISNLKLRLGYGVTGNQEGIGDYDYLAQYSLSNPAARYQFGNTFYEGYRPGGLYTGRTWEQTNTSNIGIDYGFFNERLTGSLDAYYRTTKKLLYPIPQPAGENFTNLITGNVGNMTDKGIEFSVNGKIIQKKDISWVAGLNFTVNRNNVTNLAQIKNAHESALYVTGISGGTGNTIQTLQLGYPKFSFATYQQVYGANGKPIDGVFVDQNGDGQINSSDLVVKHSPDPQEYLGFNTDFTYKGWNVGCVMRASFGNYVYYNSEATTGIQRNILNPIGVIENGNNDVLKSGLTGNGSLDLLSDYYLYNASFLRMDNAHIGYNFGKLFKNTTDLRVSFNVQNVFIVTKYPGLDPEVSGGVDNNLYPRPRTFVLSLNLGL
ncbi:MAG: SusC/RagA family TonB-linked outer membrane protein [Mucilaginibacter sp.]